MSICVLCIVFNVMISFSKIVCVSTNIVSYYKTDTKGRTSQHVEAC